jgi:hypothetical protein
MGDTLRILAGTVSLLHMRALVPVPLLLLGIVFTAGCTQSPQPRVPLQSSVPEIHPVEIRDHVQNKNEGKEPAGDLADGPKTILTCSLTGEYQPFRTPETIYSHFPK